MIKNIILKGITTIAGIGALVCACALDSDVYFNEIFTCFIICSAWVVLFGLVNYRYTGE